MPRPRHDRALADVDTLPVDLSRPKGEQVRSALTALVRSSTAGALLPSERVLSQRLSVARMTVRSYLDDLEDRGLVRKIPGRGTFVSEPRIAHSEIFRSFSEDMALRGLRPGSRNLTIRVRPATHKVAARLGIEHRAQVVHVERVRTADGTPMALERTNLSHDRFPGLECMLGPDDSLYEVLGRHFHVRLDSAQQTVSIVTLTSREARVLEVGDNVAAFLIERQSLDNMGNVVEYGRSLYRGDRYEIHMRVSHPGSAPATRRSLASGKASPRRNPT